MLGSLARKLRIFGFDTLYFDRGPDSDLIALARKGGRVILTSDVELYKRAGRTGVQALLVEGGTDRGRLASLAKGGLLTLGRPADRPPSRCAVCNGELEAISRTEASAGGAPQRAVARHRLFFRCGSCSRLYWRGGHWVRLRRLSGALEKGLT